MCASFLTVSNFTGMPEVQNADDVIHGGICFKMMILGRHTAALLPQPSLSIGKLPPE
jgi:hypothetical protein